MWRLGGLMVGVGKVNGGDCGQGVKLGWWVRGLGLG